MKVVQFFMIYNFGIQNLLKFGLLFEFQIWAKIRVCWDLKLLLILYRNFENSEYQSCSPLCDLHFCFWNHIQILDSF